MYNILECLLDAKYLPYWGIILDMQKVNDIVTENGQVEQSMLLLH